MELQSSFFPFLLCVLIFTILMKIGKRLKPNRNLLPPGPMKLPLIGNIHQLIGSLPHQKLRELAKKYGPLMHIQLGEVSTIVVSSPEMAKQVMKKHDVNFANRPSMLSMEIIAYGCTDIAYSPHGEYWRELRKICTLELLSTRRVQSFRGIREAELSVYISQTSPGGTVVWDSTCGSGSVPVNSAMKSAKAWPLMAVRGAK